MKEIITKIIAVFGFRKITSLYILLIAMTITAFLEVLSITAILPLLTILDNSNLNEIPYFNFFFNLFPNFFWENLIIFSLILFFIIFLIKNLFLAFYSWYEAFIINKLKTNLAKKLYFLYLGQSYIFHLNSNSGHLIRNLTTEIDGVKSLLHSVIKIISDTVILLFIIALIIYVEPLGAMLIFALVSSTSFIYYHITANYIDDWGKKRILHEGKKIQNLQQGFGSIKDILIYNTSDFFNKAFNYDNSRSNIAQRNIEVVQAFPKLWLELVLLTSVISLVGLLAYLSKDLSEIILILGVFGAAGYKLMPLATKLQNNIQSIKYFMPSLNLISNEINYLKKNLIKNNSSNKVEFKKEIFFKNISFSYPDSTYDAVNNINLVIKKNTFVGFFGKSGSGKSTLVDLLLGLHKPKDGKILIDGKDLSLNISGWQSKIGYVAQNINIIDDTLKKNVAFGIDEKYIDDELVMNCIKKSQLDDFLNNQPERLHTELGEKGSRLSGGQRQRIVIARALYRNPSLLVLDEPTSALDQYTSSNFLKYLKTLSNNITIIIISHDKEAFDLCDEVYEIDSGKILLSKSIFKERLDNK